MSAVYLTLVADDVLSAAALPSVLHVEDKRISELHPGFWVLQVADADAPPELQARHVELTFQRAPDGAVSVLERRATSYAGRL